MTGERPIGWWVKRLDVLLEQVVDAALAGDGLTRRHWQVLHALGSGGLAEADLHSALAPFGGPGDITRVVQELVARGWVAGPAAGRLEQTEEGRAASERVGRCIAGLRRQVTDGLGAEEYQRTVAALARMAANLERALAGAEG